MEKRRRERINRSLEELKNLILDNATTNVCAAESRLSLSVLLIISVLECTQP